MIEQVMYSNSLTINGTILSQNLTGVQRYAREIIQELTLQVDETRLRLAVLERSSAETFKGVDLIDSTLKLPRPIWTQTVLPFISEGVLLSLGNIGPILYPNQILCIHDINTILAPDSYNAAFRFYYKVMQPILGRTCRRIVSVSSFSASMLSAHGIVGSKHVEVVPNGHEHALRWDASRSTLSERIVLPEKFIFALGSRARHKNMKVVEQFAEELAQRGIAIVIAGATNPHFAAVETNNRSSNILFLGSVTDDDLAYLYSKALCFVFPSITEGFGLPALEAMTLGCPLISTSAASLPEICGDAALFADPMRPDDWLKSVTKFIESRDLRQEMRERGKIQSAKFSWAKSASTYLSLFRELS